MDYEAMEESKKDITSFDEYLRQGEQGQREKAGYWQAAIGLQAVDGLQPSDYLLQTARQHIEGDITIDDVQEKLRSYYQSLAQRTAESDATEEADRASANIARILSRRTLAFNTNGYIAVHRQIFDGVFKHAGELRPFDITKKEWVLQGDTVNYLNHEDLRRAIDYDLEQEKQFSYQGLSLSQQVEHIARFVANLWQIHAFREGNTRTTAVFAIQYLRSIGFDINNELFARHSWYFRNALVRANYRNARLGIDYDISFLLKFFRNLLMGERNELRNRYMLINPPEGWTLREPQTEQVPNKYRTSCEQANEQYNEAGLTTDENIRDVVYVIGEQQKSANDIMIGVGLKHRPTFSTNYLEPAITAGYVVRLYPDKPQHPRQRYLLTSKGKSLLKRIISEMD